MQVTTRNQSLNRIVRAYFGDKGQNTPVLAFRHGDEQDNNKALRAAYGAITKLVINAENLRQVVFDLIKEFNSTQEAQTTTATRPAPRPTPTPRVTVDDKDWSQVPSEELKGSKARGAIEERIYRAFRAVADYNDNVAPSSLLPKPSKLLI
ncbi:hypothetical protein NIES4106_57120 (plasmid) [Fischerella sp. NIES-4106]|nr:hypothetical protein NIES4106_57120 [Fischerella sp. NIES-4106]